MGISKGADGVATEQREATIGSLGMNERRTGDANEVSVSGWASGERSEPRAEVNRERRATGAEGGFR